MWPVMWLIGTSGLLYAQAMVLAACTPTWSEPIRPGPWVKATASMSSIVTFAVSSASVMTVEMFSTWMRLATSGTTPP